MLWPGFRHFRGRASLGLSSVCVCVCALLAGHSERLQFVRHMILFLKPSDTPSAEVERLMNDLHWTLGDLINYFQFSLPPDTN